MGLEYILITPAHNEEAFIEKTIQSVISQTVLPKRWVIVNDGSSDQTEAIVEKYSKGRNWIDLIRLDERKERSFAGKAQAFNTGYKMVKDLSFDVIGNLDADISFEKDHFEFLLERFLEIPKLGVAGTRYIEEDPEPEKHSFKDVGGQCQLFSRGCFEEIGGYVLSKYGGIDNIAVLTARMKGWKTISFSEKAFFHHRPMSSAESTKWKARIKHGRLDYLLGNHPLWQVFRVTYQLTRKPYLIGSILLTYGYVRALLSRMERPVSQELIDFYRKQQMQRLRLIIKGFLRGKINIKET